MSYPHFSDSCAGFHDLVRDFQGTAPTIVCLCGSTRFRDHFYAINRTFSLAGMIVVMPGVFAHAGDVITEDDKTRLDELHKRKIELADEVFVVNAASAADTTGYIGSSTRSEIEYAEKLGKPVRYLVTPEVSR